MINVEALAGGLAGDTGERGRSVATSTANPANGGRKLANTPRRRPHPALVFNVRATNTPEDPHGPAHRRPTH